MLYLARHEPYPPISWAIRLASRLPQRQYTVVTTDVPGPREPLYLLGRRLVEILPYVPIATRLRIGVAVFSYSGHVTVGVTGDYAGTPEVDRLARTIERELWALIDRYAPAAADAPPETKAVAPKKNAVAPKKVTSDKKAVAPKTKAVAPKKATTAKKSVAPKKAARSARALP